MPDVPAGQNAVSQAQELGADILAKLDRLTQQSQERAAEEMHVSLEERKRLAQEAVDRMNAIVDGFIAAVRVQDEASQQERAASDLAEIERLKASVQ